MTPENIFRITFLFIFVGVISALAYAVRLAVRLHGAAFAQAKNEVKPMLVVRGVVGIPIWFFLIDWLFGLGLVPWAFVELPPWMRWGGVALTPPVIAFFWWIHLVLGANYRGPVGLYERHELVTHGPYRWMRHPTYAAIPMVIVILFLLSANWVIGAGGFVLVNVVNLVRIPVEEAQLTERFGDEYRRYQERAGRFLPRF